VAGVKGLVSGVIPFSSVDGPGNRFVLFLQGCNFDCIACHNPYTISPCNDCGLCVEVCPSGALSVEHGVVRWNGDACASTELCVARCPYDSTPKARWHTVDEIVAQIRAHAPYLSGVTVSGGEATQQAPFVRALFEALRDDGALGRLHRLVDSNGAAPEKVWDDLADCMDGAAIDLKAFDDDVHRRMTGASNALVLRSIELLAARGSLHEVRLLLLPGVNDRPDDLARAGAWLHRVDPNLRVKVIGFRRHGVRAQAAHVDEPSAAEIGAYAEALRGIGLTNLELV
jgi:pyruvate formate lyase activating enzyme